MLGIVVDVLMVLVWDVRLGCIWGWIWGCVWGCVRLGCLGMGLVGSVGGVSRNVAPVLGLVNVLDVLMDSICQKGLA